MTELAVSEPSANLPERVGTPGTDDFDTWIAVASDVIKLANVIHDTPFVPDGLRGSGPAVAAAILAGRELGLPPLTSLANIHVIKGKPALAAVLMRALIQAQGHQWEDVDVTDTRAVIRARRRGEAEWTQVSFTADQAHKAKIDLGGYPQDKLYARATSRLARRKFADVIAGMPYSAEELEDGTEAIEGTVTESTPAPAAPAEKPRTAQRRTAKTSAAQEGSQPPSEPVTPAPPASNLPPLPGEDDTDYDTPGTATPEQLTALWATFSSDYGFKADDKEVARKTVERITRRPLDGGTTKDLSRNEAAAALDTLKRCDGDWGKLSALLDAGDNPDD